ncbi:MAG: hypothetical protein L7H18_02985 [Candidatus Nealsonbacteria bacterium DGGOD1a]|nr:MAG: hypothetical protein L7H18_02985 [Candidatus Nealsonbacteria bacterium DGGOD1a]
MLMLGAVFATDSVRNVDGFGNGSISPRAIMVHTNANLSGMFEQGLAYSYLVMGNGDREKWLPPGDNSSFGNYTHLPKAYHGGFGVFPGNCTAESMNAATIGIGLFYPREETGSQKQMEAAADLVVSLSLKNPTIQYVFGQNVTAFYLMQDALGTGSNPGGLMYNPWYFSVRRFSSIINERGKPFGISFHVVDSIGKYCNTTSGTNITHPIEYLVRNVNNQ